MLVKRVILVLHESDLQWQDIYVSFYFVAQPFGIIQSGGILLCCNDYLGREHRSKGVVNELNVLFLELVVIGKGKR